VRYWVDHWREFAHLYGDARHGGAIWRGDRRVDGQRVVPDDAGIGRGGGGINDRELHGDGERSDEQSDANRDGDVGRDIAECDDYAVGAGADILELQPGERRVGSIELLFCHNQRPGSERRCGGDAFRFVGQRHDTPIGHNLSGFHVD
jgi:hypothetical protein